MEAILDLSILDFISGGTKWAIYYFFNKLNGKNETVRFKVWPPQTSHSARPFAALAPPEMGLTVYICTIKHKNRKQRNQNFKLWKQ